MKFWILHCKIKKILFFWNSNNKIGHENIIFYYKFFHVFIEFFFFFFAIAVELKINLKSIHMIYVMTNIYLVFWMKSEISKKLIES